MSFSGASKILVKTSGETGELFIQNTQKKCDRSINPQGWVSCYLTHISLSVLPSPPGIFCFSSSDFMNENPRPMFEHEKRKRGRNAKARHAQVELRSVSAENRLPKVKRCSPFLLLLLLLRRTVLFSKLMKKLDKQTASRWMKTPFSCSWACCAAASTRRLRWRMIFLISHSIVTRRKRKAEQESVRSVNSPR